MRAHRRRDRAHAEEHADDVHVEHAPEVLERGLGEWCGQEDPGVVEQHVDAAVRLERPGDRGAPVLLAADVVRTRARTVAQLGLQAPGALAVGVGQQHERSLLGEAPRGRSADAARGTGDQRDLPLQS